MTAAAKRMRRKLPQTLLDRAPRARWPRGRRPRRRRPMSPPAKKRAKAARVQNEREGERGKRTRLQEKVICRNNSMLTRL